ncbi:hypothetical protein C0995_006547 [Termitomyces sp. Mi166|nr:hypothetical protein C0995_006547 [Termitomyces sp. Mi166\
MPSTSRLVKIPFIFATTYCVTASLTNPNPSVTDNERRPKDSKSTLFMHLSTKYMAPFRNTFWVAAVAETAAILLSEGSLTTPDIANRALHILMPGDQITNLRLTPLSITGSLLVVGGCWLRLKCFRTLRQFYTFEITLRENHKLITSGPYRYVRHPGYTAFTTIFIGMCCWFSSRGSWVRESGILATTMGKGFIGTFMAVYVKMWVSLLQRMPEEDKLMRASFGKEWEDWARRVPYWLIPGVY